MEKEIIQYEEKLLKAMKNSDTEVLDELIHDNLIFNIPTGDIITKEMDLATYKLKQNLENVDCVERKIEVFGDTAIVSTIVYIKGSLGDVKLDNKVRFFRTWKKIDKRWKVIGGASIEIG